MALCGQISRILVLTTGFLVAQWWWALLTKQEACKRCVFDPWVGKIPWRRAWQPTPVSLPGESLGQRSWRVTVRRVAKIRLRWQNACRHACVFIFLRTDGVLCSPNPCEPKVEKLWLSANLLSSSSLSGPPFSTHLPYESVWMPTGFHLWGLSSNSAFCAVSKSLRLGCVLLPTGYCVIVSSVLIRSAFSVFYALFYSFEVAVINYRTETK